MEAIETQASKTDSTTDATYKPKIDKSGAGFNQFDPVLSLTRYKNHSIFVLASKGPVHKHARKTHART